MTAAQAAAFLTAHDNYLILTHVRPDGDTIGCAAGLCRALRQIGKTAYVLENPQATSLFTPYFSGLTAPEGYTPETVVSGHRRPGAVPGERPGLSGAGGSGH